MTMEEQASIEIVAKALWKAKKLMGVENIAFENWLEAERWIIKLKKDFYNRDFDDEEQTLQGG